MKKGSVIVDLAAEAGGNVAGSKAGEVVEINGVKIIGYTDLPSRLAGQSSALYSNNITKLLQSMTDKEGNFTIDMKDEVVKRSILTRNGEKLWPCPEPLPQLDAAKKKPEKKTEISAAKKDTFSETLKNAIWSGIGLSSFIGVGVLCPDPVFLGMVTTFSLAAIAGYQSVWSVTPALHTPLMSVTNAISGLTAAGGLLCLGGGVLPGTIP